LTDTEGNPLFFWVHPANENDRNGARQVLSALGKEKFPKIVKVKVDQGYDGAPLAQWVKEHLGWEVEVVKREEGSGFVVQKLRWKVERTLAWLGRWRVLSKDYDATCHSARARLHFVSCAILLRKLKP